MHRFEMYEQSASELHKKRVDMVSQFSAHSFSLLPFDHAFHSNCCLRYEH